MDAAVGPRSPSSSGGLATRIRLVELARGEDERGGGFPGKDERIISVESDPSLIREFPMKTA